MLLETASAVGRQWINSIPYFYSLRPSDSAISTGISIRTLAQPYRPVCKCIHETDILHDEVCAKVAQAARHNHVRDIIAKHLRQRPSTDVHIEPYTSEGVRGNDIGIRGPGRGGTRDIDYDAKVYSPKSVRAADAGIGRRRRAGDTDPVEFRRTQFNTFLAAVGNEATANKPDSRVGIQTAGALDRRYDGRTDDKRVRRVEEGAGRRLRKDGDNGDKALAAQGESHSSRRPSPSRQQFGRGIGDDQSEQEGAIPDAYW